MTGRRESTTVFVPLPRPDLSDDDKDDINPAALALPIHQDGSSESESSLSSTSLSSDDDTPPLRAKDINTNTDARVDFNFMKKVGMDEEEMFEESDTSEEDNDDAILPRRSHEWPEVNALIESVDTEDDLMANLPKVPEKYAALLASKQHTVSNESHLRSRKSAKTTTTSSTSFSSREFSQSTSWSQERDIDLDDSEEEKIFQKLRRRWPETKQSKRPAWRLTIPAVVQIAMFVVVIFTGLMIYKQTKIFELQGGGKVPGIVKVDATTVSVTENPYLHSQTESHASRVLINPYRHHEACSCLEVSPENMVGDCCCNLKDVNEVNNNLYDNLHELLNTSFFRYYKVNLNKNCPFWNENSLCHNRACAVEETEEEEVPPILRGKGLGDVEFTLNDAAAYPYVHHDSAKDFCVLDDSDHDCVYVNLRKNPERFTGYSGESSRRIWRAIYEENCFNGSALSSNETCYEERVFSRLISGLHASIGVHLSYQYYDSVTDSFLPNVDLYLERVGNHPERIKNLYFLYVFLLRAMSRVSGYVENYPFATGNPIEDVLIKDLVKSFNRAVRSCPSYFDEHGMFSGTAASLVKEDFRLHFQNISRIMDCVGCEKCRLWGKVQTQGLGTALKVLFSFEVDDEGSTPDFNLRPTELIALTNAFGRFTESIKAVEKFDEMIAKGNWRKFEKLQFASPVQRNPFILN